MRRDQSLRIGAAALGIAGGVEFGLQMGIGIILSRYLDEIAFAQYRLLWLLAGTALAVAPMFMPQSLFYFLNRVPASERGVHVSSVLIFLAAAGLVTGLVVSSFNPWLQGAPRALFDDTAGMSALFLALWVVVALLDVLPTADGRMRWQAGATVAFAVIRTALLAAIGIMSGSIEWIAAGLLVLAAVKLLMLCIYIRRYIGRGIGSFDFSVLRTQLAYAFPFAIGHSLFLLRVQADQWVVVAMLPTAMYATFSVAAVILPVATLIRSPVNNALLGGLNRAFANGELAEAARLIAVSNAATAMVLIPVLGALFVCAPELVEILYTSRYAGAAPIMQVYLIGMTINAFAVGHTLSALNHGKFAAINSGFCLLLSIALCVVGINHFGMAGAAAATMLTLAVSELWMLVMVARTLGTTPLRLTRWRAILPSFAGMIGAMFVVDLLASGWSMALWQAVVAKSVLYAAVFMPIFFILGGWQVLGEVVGSRMAQAVMKRGAQEAS